MKPTGFAASVGRFLTIWRDKSDAPVCIKCINLVSSWGTVVSKVINVEKRTYRIIYSCLTKFLRRNLESFCSTLNILNIWISILVGGFNLPLWKNDGVKVSWDYCSQYMESHKIPWSSHHQPVSWQLQFQSQPISSLRPPLGIKSRDAQHHRCCKLQEFL